jgi:aconitate hydratase
MVSTYVTPEMYKEKYKDIFHVNELWNKLPGAEKNIYKWSEASTYIKKPPFFDKMQKEAADIKDIKGAYALAVFGDTITTDHISPAGSINESSDASNYLISQNVKPEHFNSYGSRRGTHEVMMRGTFANIRIRNRMISGVEGGFTKHIPSNKMMSIYEACMKYHEADTPLIIIAGKEYGTGSSRDWAAKGTALLGVRAVLAESFERIHKSNLVGMGVLPLQFLEGTDAESMGITGYERFEITGIADNLYPNKKLQVTAVSQDGMTKGFEVIARLDSKIEVEYYSHGGILNMIMRNFL